MQKYQKLLFPALALCFILLLGGYALGRRSLDSPVLTTQYPAPTLVEASVRSLPAGSGDTVGTEDRRLDLNRATLEELMELPGIGEVRARAILDYRETQGPFLHAADLMQVPGIGEGIFSGLRDLVYVEEHDENSDH